ncbi:MAG: hemolysin family protein [Treponema sp.]|jgi:putative hemolysin|nr:hemolysin family protein [Treponema sp.]
MIQAILITLLLIIASGIFTLFDSALGLCRKTRLEKEQSKSYKSVLTALEKKQMYSLACKLWINILRVPAAIFTFLFVSFIFKFENIGGSMAIRLLITAVLFGLLAALLGDGLPKLCARASPEKIAAALLPFIKVFSFPLLIFVIPSLKFASFFNSTFHLENASTSMTEDELHRALLEGEKSGIVESKERIMVESVFYLGDRHVGAFMTHRSEIQWLDCSLPYEEIKEKALEYRFQRCYPVVNGSPDEIIGAVYLEDIIIDQALPNPQGLRAIMKKAQFVPETMSALKAFESFKQGEANFLFVMDEYGGLAGIISITALVEEIVGELSVPAAKEEPLAKQEDGSFLADGTMNIDDAAKALSLTGLPEDGDFHTLAGFVLFLAGELPGAGDSFKYQGYSFKIKEMDGNRIDKILISKIEK